MKYVPFDHTQDEVSVIGFGCWQMGHWMWTGVRDEDSIAAVRRALDLGITLFDTADIYGFGHSETILAKALGQDLGKVFIATKGGVRHNDERGYWRDTSPEWIIEACEASLKRLGRECVDLYQIHWPSADHPLDDVMDALNRLRESGKARYVGVSNFFKDQIELMLMMGVIHSLQPQLNILKRKVMHTSTMHFCRERGISVLAYGPLCEGILGGGVTMDTQYSKGDNRHGHDEYEPSDRRAANLNIVETLRQIARERAVSPAQVAIRWTLDHAGATVALCGARTPAHIEDSAASADWKLSADEIDVIERSVAEYRPDLLSPAHEP